MEEKEVEFSVLPNGDILVSRSFDKTENGAKLRILSEVANNVDEIREFFKAGENCRKILGNQPRCG